MWELKENGEDAAFEAHCHRAQGIWIKRYIALMCFFSLILFGLLKDLLFWGLWKMECENVANDDSTLKMTIQIKPLTFVY